MYEESEATWAAVLENLKARGLRKAWPVVSDAHRGIQSAVRKHLLGASWQRCKVHLMRNVMGRVQQRDKKLFAEKLKQIWIQPDRKGAVRTAKIFIAEYRDRYPEAVAVLAEGWRTPCSSMRFLSSTRGRLHPRTSWNGCFERFGDAAAWGACFLVMSHISGCSPAT